MQVTLSFDSEVCEGTGAHFLLFLILVLMRSLILYLSTSDFNLFTGINWTEKVTKVVKRKQKVIEIISNK